MSPTVQVCGSSEVVSLKVTDIDSKRMMIRVEQGKGRKDRYAMLSPRLLDLLRDWWRHCAAAGLAVPGPRPGTADDHAPAQSRLPCRRPDGRDQQARLAAYLAAQLRHPPLIRDGRLIPRNLSKEMITEDELKSQLREQNVEDYADIRLATLEGDGRLSVLKRK